jgi:4-hydroxy-tetrahydrodipicolinate synthase
MFKGSIVALVTPFTKDNKIDEKALKKLVDWHIENKTDAIVCCGTTGESPTLSDEEKLLVTKICVKRARGKIKIIAGSGTYNTSKSLELTKKIKGLGASGALIVVPYYNRPTPFGIIAHFKEIAKLNFPLILYHHPGRTGVKISIETFKKLLKVKNIVAVKEASSDLDFIFNLQKNFSTPILSGDDNLTFKIMKNGGDGVISVAANIVPKVFKELVTNCLSKNFKEAEKISKKYKKLCDAMVLETNPQCIKYAMSLMGLCTPFMRLPLVEPKREVRDKIKKVLLEYNLLKEF